MKLATTPEEQKAWMQQWRSAAVGLWEMKAKELRAMTEDDAARIVCKFFSDPFFYRVPKLDPTTSGLVEQQRIFARGKR